jgi:hypothetical protein
MSRLINLLLIFTIVFPSSTHSQSFDVLTSKIFFSVDINKHDSTILSYFNARPELTLRRDIGWTVYTPTNNNGNPILYYRFSFSKHPYFSSGVDSGVVMVMTNKDSYKVIGMSLSLSFKSAQVFDSSYRSIKGLYGKYASKTIKRPNITQPFEVTKYFAKEGGDYVLITKGESNNKPYIHIAYNYQDYDW